VTPNLPALFYCRILDDIKELAVSGSPLRLFSIFVFMLSPMVATRDGVAYNRWPRMGILCGLLIWVMWQPQ
jgi:hypothetical protein